MKISHRFIWLGEEQPIYLRAFKQEMRKFLRSRLEQSVLRLLQEKQHYISPYIYQ